MGTADGSRVRVAILGEARPSFPKAMAEGLARMVTAAGGEPKVFYDGLEALTSTHRPRVDFTTSLRQRVKRMIRRTRDFRSLARELRGYDVVVVVSTVPRAFFGTYFSDDLVRSLLATVPLVLYDLYYLPTRGLWGQWLRDADRSVGMPEGPHRGLDRYDWYLCVSVVSECALPDMAHPYSLVGLNLDDGSLYPAQNGEFLAVLDFENPPDMGERAVQIRALQRTNTPFVVLNGHYSIEEIRAIYRRSALFFLAMRESFGLPICELQACGSYIVTPYSNWCPSHWKKPLSQKGEGRLSSNFIVYDNDEDRLVQEILRIRQSYNPQQVRDTFLREDPQYYWGDPDALREFLELVRSRRIHPQLHISHKNVPLPTAADVPDWPRPRPEATGRQFRRADAASIP